MNMFGQYMSGAVPIITALGALVLIKAVAAVMTPIVSLIKMPFRLRDWWLKRKIENEKAAADAIVRRDRVEAAEERMRQRRLPQFPQQGAEFGNARAFANANLGAPKRRDESSETPAKRQHRERSESPAKAQDDFVRIALTTAQIAYLLHGGARKYVLGKIRRILSPQPEFSKLANTELLTDILANNEPGFVHADSMISMLMVILKDADDAIPKELANGYVEDVEIDLDTHLFRVNSPAIQQVLVHRFGMMQDAYPTIFAKKGRTSVSAKDDAWMHMLDLMLIWSVVM
jgi:hypothetical protein